MCQTSGTDHREKRQIIKLVKSTAEETRIKMRRQRDDVNKSISTEIDKDLKFKTKNDLQKEWISSTTVWTAL